jgi:Flp pilus assembly pilin Flp
MKGAFARIRAAAATFVADEQGATAIEYGLIAAALATVLVIVLPVLRVNVAAIYSVLTSGIAAYLAG